MSPPKKNNWRERRTEHRFHAEIVTVITTRNSEHKRSIAIEIWILCNGQPDRDDDRIILLEITQEQRSLFE